MTEEKASVPAVKDKTYSQRFTEAVIREFGAEIGVVSLTPYQRQLAQHMFVAIDTQLKFLEAKRLELNPEVRLPITWVNINMGKLALDAVHRIELGLDGLVPNHIHPIPYYNKIFKKYDLDLRIGYVGKDYYRRKMAQNPPADIIYELVYSKDKFKPIKRSAKNPVESYDLEITDPFDRGDVVGGFGYIMYDDATRNRLVLISMADFEKSRKAAKSGEFWSKHTKEMQLKTIVHRVTNLLQVDPQKVNASYVTVEMNDAEENAVRQIEEKANQEVIDIEAIHPEEKMEPAKTKEASPDENRHEKGKEEAPSDPGINPDF